MMRCLASAKFSMFVDIIKPSSAPSTEGGHWEWVQNEESGALVQEWVTDTNDDGIVGSTIVGVKCVARTAITGSIRAAEQFGAEYLNDEWVKLTLPFHANITLRDKVTNIRTLRGQVLWSEEESDGNPPTTFDVFRVSPVVDGFGQPVEKVALVKRAEVQ